jgi:tetratricopeptide (TPR) repeat protein
LLGAARRKKLFMAKFPRFPVLLLAAAAACGGAPESSPPFRPEAAPLLVTLGSPDGPGVVELRSGRSEAARARFEAVLARDPERLAALNDLAVCYALEDRRDAARSLLDEVVARGTPREQLVALVNLSELYALDGYLTAAWAHLETARSIDRQRAEPLYAQALLADARGETLRALALAREAARADEAAGARASLVFLQPEEQVHLEALLAEVRGDRELALARWRELRGGRFPLLAQAAQRHLDGP